MPSEMIKIATEDGREFDGYLARPEKANGAGIIVIQEIFGVNEHIRQVCDLYAKAGYTVLAPEVFWRTDPGLKLGYSDAEIQKGISIVGKLDHDVAAQDLISAVATLKKIAGVQKVGAVGYCMGGALVYGLTCRNAVDAGVSYYGGGIDQHLEYAAKIKTPLLMHFAEDDSYIPLSAVEKIKQAVAHANATVYLYEGVHHGFNCDQRGSYNRPAAMLAFARSLEFFNKNLVEKAAPVQQAVAAH
jgi:carboxymethylenebutenolidase